MGKGENKIMRRRLANAYLSSVISISLVLLLVGVASMLLVNAKSVSDYFKENMRVSVIMQDNVSEEKAMKYCDKLKEEKFIKTTEESGGQPARAVGRRFSSSWKSSGVVHTSAESSGT